MISERLKPGLGTYQVFFSLVYYVSIEVHDPSCACTNDYSHVVNTYLFGLVSFQFITYYTSGGPYSRVVLVL